MEAVIVAGLKRPADRMTDAGVQGGLDTAMPKLAELGRAVLGAVRARLGRLADWAVARSLAPNSLTGISLLLALCAAAWFSAGTRNDVTPGMLALCGWLLARVSAGRLAGSRSAGFRSMRFRSIGFRSGASRPAAARVMAGGTDWLVLPAASWDDGPGPAAPVPGRPAAGEVALPAATHDVNWPSAVSATAAECAIYGGIAAGGQSAGWTGMWPLAVAAIVAVALRQTIGSCGGRSGGPAVESGPAAPRLSTVIWRKTGQLLAPPVGARVLLAAVALAAHGPRVALFAILAVQVISLCHATAVRRPATWADGSGTGDRQPGTEVPPHGRAGTLVAVPTRQDVVLACRDDGAGARWAGRAVRGNIIPLPAALAGGSAVVLLAALGLRNLAGVLALTPPVVMLLAAPGSGHPHDGRADWLVPAVLQAGQYIYLAALGFAWAVPGPVVYSLCALTAIWYANRAADSAGTLAMLRRDRDDGSPPTACAGTGIGWEGRMFAITVGAMLGLAPFACLAVAAYLGVLIGRKILIGYLLPGEDDRR